MQTRSTNAVKADCRDTLYGSSEEHCVRGCRWWGWIGTRTQNFEFRALVTYGFKALVVIIGTPHRLRVFRLMEVCKAAKSCSSKLCSLPTRTATTTTTAAATTTTTTTTTTAPAAAAAAAAAAATATTATTTATTATATATTTTTTTATHEQTQKKH